MLTEKILGANTRLDPWMQTDHELSGATHVFDGLTRSEHIIAEAGSMLSQLGGVRLGLASKRRLRRWLRSVSASPELELTLALVVRRTDAVEEARDRAERYARLREKWTVRDPDIKGGEPVIRDSRMSVHMLAARIARGESPAVLEEDFPHISAEAREIAVQYARANSRRGRPRRPSSAR